MDPNETLRLWCAATEKAETCEAHEYREALVSWLWKGGFEPDWTAHMLGPRLRDSADVQFALKLRTQRKDELCKS